MTELYAKRKALETAYRAEGYSSAEAKKRAAARAMGKKTEQEIAAAVASMGLADFDFRRGIGDRMGLPPSEVDPTKFNVFPYSVGSREKGYRRLGLHQPRGAGDLRKKVGDEYVELAEGDVMVFGRPGLTDNTTAHEYGHTRFPAGQPDQETVQRQIDALTARDVGEWDEAVEMWRQWNDMSSFEEAEMSMINNLTVKEGMWSAYWTSINKPAPVSRWKQVLAKKFGEFDPEGDKYDYVGAIAAGVMPQRDPDDGKLHWSSRDPKTGMLLKGRKHKTWPQLEQGEAEAGYEIYRGEDGRYYSRKK